MRVSNSATPKRQEGSKTPRKDDRNTKVGHDRAKASQHRLGSPSTPSQHLLPVALFSPATSSVRVTTTGDAAIAWVPAALLQRADELRFTVFLGDGIGGRDSLVLFTFGNRWPEPTN